jgi:hypothetical protein
VGERAQPVAPEDVDGGVGDQGLAIRVTILHMAMLQV